MGETDVLTGCLHNTGLLLGFGVQYCKCMAPLYMMHCTYLVVNEKEKLDLIHFNMELSSVLCQGNVTAEMLGGNAQEM